jgi:hypothetical protein
VDTAVFLALLTFCGAIVAGFFKLMDKLSTALDANTASNQRIADEAKERNGHLAEITVQSRDQILDKIQNIGEQHVKKQVVDEQTVNS